MSRAAPDIAATQARLETLATETLRDEWRRLHETLPPRRLSRDMLMRGVVYKLQENAFGGLSKSSLNKLQGPDSDGNDPSRMRRQPRITLKPGTRLVREWHDVTHTVVILADGVEWRGRRYKSLSTVAREITGARWSGPRFFGLTARRSDG